MERAKILFAGYRRGDASDPDFYVAAIAAVLAGYDAELIRDVTDPRSGISATEKFASFLPNSGELKLFCDGRAAHRDRMRKYADMPKPDTGRVPLPRPPGLPGRRANLNVPMEHPRYHELYARATDPAADPAEFKFTPGGIKVALSWWRSR